MTIQEKIKKKIEGFKKFVYVLIKGDELVDEHIKSPWISVEDDLPCNHEELMDGEFQTKFVIVSTNGINKYFAKTIFPETYANTANAAEIKTVGIIAKPSKPSVKFTALLDPTITKYVKITNPTIPNG